MRIRGNPLTLAALMFWCSVPVRAQRPQPASQHQRTAPAISDSVTARRIAESAIRQFVGTWRRAWQRSDSLRQFEGVFDGSIPTRLSYTHCHASEGPTDFGAQAIDPRATPILARIGSFAKCPTWLLGRFAFGGDEADQIDLALVDSLRPPVRADRQVLLTLLDSLQTTITGDPWLIGQRVRFLLDQGLTDDALLTARSCLFDGWWCSALRGYVLAHRGELVAAAAAYTAATMRMPEAVGCEWSDVQNLLNESDRARFAKLPCAVRDSLSRTYWWMSDPLFADSVNERALEHAVRKTMVLLRKGVGVDERYEWSSRLGGDVIGEMLVRYGSPTTAVWMGEGTDKGHSGYLQARHSTPSPPYSTAEYTSGRYAFGPQWKTMTSPFLANAGSWELRPTPGTRDRMFGLGTLWWPPEHMRWKGPPIAILPEGQWATFRRRASLRLGAAFDVSAATPDAQHIFADSTTSFLIASPGPDSIHVAGRTVMATTSRVAFDVLLPPEPMVLGIESFSLHGVAAARTRRGWMPPPTLSLLHADSIALSDAVLIHLLPGRELPANIDQALPLMFGSTNIGRDESVGVFWETYGAQPGDSVYVSVAVVPLDDVGLLRRLGASLRLVSGPTKGIAIAWQDPIVSDAVRAGAVPILPRALALNLSLLPAGRYALDLTVSTPTREPARTRRVFTLR